MLVGRAGSRGRIGRGAGNPSSSCAVATSVTGWFAVTVRTDSPSTVSVGGSFTKISPKIPPPLFAMRTFLSM